MTLKPLASTISLKKMGELLCQNAVKSGFFDFSVAQLKGMWCYNLLAPVCSFRVFSFPIIPIEEKI